MENEIVITQGDMLIQYSCDEYGYRIQFSCGRNTIICRHGFTMKNTKLINRTQDMTDFVTKLFILVSCADRNNFSNDRIVTFIDQSDEMKKHADNIKSVLFH